MAVVEDEAPEVENKFHAYVGNRIPWWVRLAWVGFWCFVTYYTIIYLIPDLQLRLLNPPS